MAARRPITTLAHQAALTSTMRFPPHRSTKIICTIGPASFPLLPEMLLAGMNVARINCAHGSKQGYADIVRGVRAAEAALRASGAGSPARTGRALCGSRADAVAIAFDIKGPEIRVGRFGAGVPPNVVVSHRPDGTVVRSEGQKEVMLRVGDVLTLTTDPARSEQGSAGEMYVSYAALPSRAAPGQTIFVDDGNLELRVLSTDPAAGTLRVESRSNAPLGERKNVNLPGMSVDLPAVTAKDEVDLATARELGATFIFASFVQSADAVRRIRALCTPDMRIISKIESQDGLDNYDEILGASDGIMVARGDLGVQIPAERVVLAQKMMIARANVVGKPVICATQMLDSMVHHARPTRAEVVDVASAVLDGADAVMLSGETAKGAFPLEAVGVMARTATAAEAAFPHRAFFNALAEHPGVPVGVGADEAFALHEAHARAKLARAGRGGAVEYLTASDVEALGGSAVNAAFELKAAAIVVLSLTGRTAAAVAKYRPAVPVLCLCVLYAPPRRSTAPHPPRHNALARTRTHAHTRTHTQRHGRGRCAQPDADAGRARGAGAAGRAAWRGRWRGRGAHARPGAEVREGVGRGEGGGQGGFVPRQRRGSDRGRVRDGGERKVKTKNATSSVFKHTNTPKENERAALCAARATAKRAARQCARRGKKPGPGARGQSAMAAEAAAAGDEGGGLCRAGARSRRRGLLLRQRGALALRAKRHGGRGKRVSTTSVRSGRAPSSTRKTPAAAKGPKRTLSTPSSVWLDSRIFM